MKKRKSFVWTYVCCYTALYIYLCLPSLAIYNTHKDALDIYIFILLAQTDLLGLLYFVNILQKNCKMRLIVSITR